MNDELKYDHFENTEELLKNIDIWYRTDDIYFSRWFGLNDLNNLRIYINQLQSNWNSLREELKKHKDILNCRWQQFANHKNQNKDMLNRFESKIEEIDFALDKMNELERKK